MTPSEELQAEIQRFADGEVRAAATETASYRVMVELGYVIGTDETKMRATVRRYRKEADEREAFETAEAVVTQFHPTDLKRKVVRDAHVEGMKTGIRQCLQSLGEPR